jgi:hypothetical protein
MDFKKQIQKLTAQEISELQADKALRLMETNVNLLVDLEKELFDKIRDMGMARIAVEQLKSYKSTIVEINRALSKVVQNG